jgi:hypothetical protein
MGRHPIEALINGGIMPVITSHDTPSSGGKPPDLDELGYQAAKQAAEDLNHEAPAGNLSPETAALLAGFLRALGAGLEAGRLVFPLHVLPPLLRKYITACARSIHCPPDLIAVPLLAIAGAATGRSGRWLKVKDGWLVSSCLWTACLSDSSGGKTPALNAAQSFFDDRQEAEHQEYEEARKAHAEDPKNNPHPGPYPALVLTDTTIESLRSDLASGPVLFSRDELGGWCHQMGQYKQGNADRYDWCSCWSHAPINIGRKTSERVHVKSPFVAVTGMMVPASARELNYRGHADDGFVHRMLLAHLHPSLPVATVEGVPDDLAAEYRTHMAQLFDSPAAGSEVLTFEPESAEGRRNGALDMVLRWANDELFYELAPLTYPDYVAPGWLQSKYRKLYENCLRLCLVLHEIWRVADGWKEREAERGTDADDYSNELTPEEVESVRATMADYWLNRRDFYGTYIPFKENVVDRLTVERAIAVIDYFRAHIGPVQSILGEDVDAVDRLRNKLRGDKPVTVRQVIHQSTYKTAGMVLALFAEWERRGYGTVNHPRKNQTVFAFRG